MTKSPKDQIESLQALSLAIAKAGISIIPRPCNSILFIKEKSMQRGDVLYYKDSGIRTGKLHKIIKHKDYPCEDPGAFDADYDPEKEIVIYMTSKTQEMPPWDLLEDVTTVKPNA